ncbi:MAG TPA: hypothetical protein VI451_12900, partial [Anaerolineales bacterium]|nr:hypothetical protein [Anaerolineales bacterium]
MHIHRSLPILLLLALCGCLFLSSSSLHLSGSPSLIQAEFEPDLLALAQGPTPTLALVAPSDPQPPAGLVDVQIAIAGVSDLGAFELDVQVDTSLVQVVGITLQDFLGGTASCNPNTSRCAV